MINSVSKAMQILEIISEGKSRPITLARIAECTGIHKSTCSHIISTLAEEGYVVRVSTTKGYVLGPALYCLLGYGRYDSEFVDICHPVLKFLAKKIGGVATLAVIMAEKMYVIDQISEDPNDFEKNISIWTEDVYSTAVGQILLSNMTESELVEVFEKNISSGEQPMSIESLKAKMANIDKNGIVRVVAPKGAQISVEYAVAVCRYSQCVGALGLTAFCEENEWDGFLETEDFVKKLLLKARNEINQRLICKSRESES